MFPSSKINNRLTIILLSKFSQIECTNTIYSNFSIEPGVHNFFRIPCHYPLNRCEVKWVIHRRRKLQWHIRCVDVTRVKQARTLMAQQQGVRWEVWVAIYLVTTSERTYSFDTHVILVLFWRCV